MKLVFKLLAVLIGEREEERNATTEELMSESISVPFIIFGVILSLWAIGSVAESKIEWSRLTQG